MPDADAELPVTGHEDAGTVGDPASFGAQGVIHACSVVDPEGADWGFEAVAEPHGYNASIEQITGRYTTVQLCCKAIKGVSDVSEQRQTTALNDAGPEFINAARSWEGVAQLETELDKRPGSNDIGENDRLICIDVADDAGIGIMQAPGRKRTDAGRAAGEELPVERNIGVVADRVAAYEIEELDMTQLHLPGCDKAIANRDGAGDECLTADVFTGPPAPFHGDTRESTP